MNHVTWRENVAVWAFLVFASIATVWMVERETVFGAWTVAIILAVAVLKARAIVLYYMEVKFAPWQLRAWFEAWIAICFGVIVGFWYFS